MLGLCGLVVDSISEAVAETAAPLAGFNLTVAVLSTVLALVAIAIAWYLYSRRFRELQKLPTARRPDDPLRSILGPVFTLLENKYWVDELYHAIIVQPYVIISRFLADKVDWAFWHDFFHDKIITAGYNGLARLLSVQIDLGFIDAIANALGNGTQQLAAVMRRLQSGYVRNYALSVLIGVVVIISYIILR